MTVMTDDVPTAKSSVSVETSKAAELLEEVVALQHTQLGSDLLTWWRAGT